MLASSIKAGGIGVAKSGQRVSTEEHAASGQELYLVFGKMRTLRRDLGGNANLSRGGAAILGGPRE